MNPAHSRMAEVNGIILAGGQSLRFGEDKAFVKVGDSILIESLICFFEQLFDDVIVVTNYPEKYSKYPVKVVVDQIKGVGPLGGIHAGLSASNSEHNFVMACDMPFPRPKLVKYLGARVKGQEVIIPKREEKLEPLFAVYSKKCIKAIEKQIQTGNYKIQEIFNNLDVEFVDSEIVKKYDPGFLSFLNLNSKKDMEKIDKCLKRQKLNVSA